MSERRAQTFPRRDDAGRVISLAEMLAATAAGLVLGFVALLVIDGVFALIGLGSFGNASGWLALILPIMLFVDDFRGWRTAGWRRIVVGLVAAGLSLAAGLLAANLARSLPGLVSGAIGAVVFGLIYAVIWFVWIRWISGQVVEGDER